MYCQRTKIHVSGVDCHLTSNVLYFGYPAGMQTRGKDRILLCDCRRSLSFVLKGVVLAVIRADYFLAGDHQSLCVKLDRWVVCSTGERGRSRDGIKKSSSSCWGRPLLILSFRAIFWLAVSGGWILKDPRLQKGSDRDPR